MKFKYILTSLILCQFLFACEKKQDKSESSFQALSTTFLTDSDFSSTNEEIASQSEVTTGMSEWSELWHYKASQSSSSSSISSDSCFTNFTINLKNQNSIYVGGSEDLTNCMQAQLTNSDFSITKFKVKMFMEVSCTNVDLSSYSGQVMTNSVLQQIETTCGTAAHSVLSNSEIESGMTINMNGNSIQFSSVSYYSSTNAAGGACTSTYSNSNWIHTDCTERYKVHTINGGLDTTKNGKDAITKLTKNNVIESSTATDPFFISGSLDIYFKGWSGTLTYNGVNTAASWSLSSNNVTQTGSLSPTQSLVQLTSDDSLNQILKDQVIQPPRFTTIFK